MGRTAAAVQIPYRSEALPQNLYVPLDRLIMPRNWNTSAHACSVTPAPAPNSGGTAPRSGIAPGTGSLDEASRSIFLVPGSDGRMIAPGDEAEFSRLVLP